MAARILVVPGTNPILSEVARRLEGNPIVAVLESANAALWQIRHAPPQILVSDSQLKEMEAGDLVDIVAALNPQVRVILSGAGSAELGRVVRAAGGQLIEHDKPPEQLVQQMFQILGVSPTPRPERPPVAASAPRPATAQPGTAGGTAAPTRPPAPAAPRPMTGGAPTPGANRPTTVDPSQKRPGDEGGRPAATDGQPWMPRGGAQVIQPQQMSVIQTLLGNLAVEVGAHCVLLSDTVGMRLFEVGAVPPAIGPAIEPLLSTAFSTADQLARLLKEQEARSLFLHEGTRYDIYAFNVGQRFILTLIFDKNENAGKLGAVWVYAKRAIRQLQITLEQ